MENGLEYMKIAKQYEQINECLNHLQFLLLRMGITEFSISKNNRQINWALSGVVDKGLLESFCTNIRDVYKKAKEEA